MFEVTSESLKWRNGKDGFNDFHIPLIKFWLFCIRYSSRPKIGLLSGSYINSRTITLQIHLFFVSHYFLGVKLPHQ